MAVFVSAILFQEWLALIIAWYVESLNHDHPIYLLFYTELLSFLVMAALFFALFVLIVRLLQRNHRVLYESSQCFYITAAVVEISALCIRSLYSLLLVTGATR